MTEDEAKTRWCPFARQFISKNPDDPTTNGTDDFHCIASRCMAWRFEKVGYLRNKETNFVRPVKDIKSWSSDSEEWFEMAGNTGFCGLAGKP